MVEIRRFDCLVLFSTGDRCFLVTIEQKVDATTFIGFLHRCGVFDVAAKIQDITSGLGLGHKLHIESAGLVHIGLKGQIDRLGRSRSGGAGKQFVIGSNLLPHDHDLVPVLAGAVANGCLELAGRIDKRVTIAPNEVDFAKLGQQVVTVRLDFQCTIDQISGLVIQTVGHMEVGLRNRVGLIKTASVIVRKLIRVMFDEVSINSDVLDRVKTMAQRTPGFPALP